MECATAWYNKCRSFAQQYQCDTWIASYQRQNWVGHWRAPKPTNTSFVRLFMCQVAISLQNTVDISSSHPLLGRSRDLPRIVIVLWYFLKIRIGLFRAHLNLPFFRVAIVVAGPWIKDTGLDFFSSRYVCHFYLRLVVHGTDHRDSIVLNCTAGTGTPLQILSQCFASVPFPCHA